MTKNAYIANADVPRGKMCLWSLFQMLYLTKGEARAGLGYNTPRGPMTVKKNLLEVNTPLLFPHMCVSETRQFIYSCMHKRKAWWNLRRKNSCPEGVVTS